jgi:cation diffusion facilitator CzcD-associated flavoprotein CzcO
MTSGREQAWEVAIIGSGFGGMCAALRLHRAGIKDYVLLERGSDVGGTWRDNTYPGCAVDISTLQYSLSFEPKRNWTRLYATQQELFEYFTGLAAKYGVYAHAQFDSEVQELRFDEDHGRWHLSLSGGRAVCARFVINATGILSQPSIPAVPGVETFTGPVFHSAQWDHSADLVDKKVVAVGSGASAVQFVPAIAPHVKHLTVLQRTPPWVYPRSDRSFTLPERLAHRYIPGLQRVRRAIRWARNDIVQLGLERNSKLISQSKAAGEEFLARSVPDPDLRALLTPDYEPGCKRRIISDDWYPALQRANVTVARAGIAAIDSSGVTDTDGTHHEADAVIFGTGFRATDFLAPMKVFGRHGAELGDHWRGGARTHLGSTISGFPNLFLVYGPSAGLGNNSAVFMIECQVRYALAAIRHTRRRGLHTIEVRPEVERRSYTALQHRFKGTVYTSGCAGWYQSPDGHVDTLWPGTTAEFWLRTRWFNARQYTSSK